MSSVADLLITHKERQLWSFQRISYFCSHNVVKVEKILKGCLDSIPSPSPSAKIQIMGGKVCLRCTAKHCWVMSTNFLFSKVC